VDCVDDLVEICPLIRQPHEEQLVARDLILRPLCGRWCAIVAIIRVVRALRMFRRPSPR
jgi:hypothetical protein